MRKLTTRDAYALREQMANGEDDLSCFHYRYVMSIFASTPTKQSHANNLFCEGLRLQQRTQAYASPPVSGKEPTQH